MKFVFVALIIAAVFAQSTGRCSHTFENPDPAFALKAKFNLLPLANADYGILDNEASGSWRNYTYYFQICDVVANVPTPNMGQAKKCYQTGEEDPVHYPAYQVSNSGDLCLRLGNTASESDVVWKLIDNHDPSIGVKYSYINGDDYYCGGTKRSFILEITCQDNKYNVPDEETVYEDNCSYKVAFDSIYGCPIECGLDRNRLCGSRGVCRFDSDTRAPHCYCQQGYTGFSCSDKGEQKAEGFTSMTFICVAILAFLICVEVMVVLMWDRVKKLRLDPSAYSNIAEADELA